MHFNALTSQNEQPPSRLLYANKTDATSIDDGENALESQRIVKFPNRRIFIAATVLGIASIGAAFAYNNLQSEQNRTAPANLCDSAIGRLNPNGSELVVRAFTIQSSSGVAGTKHAFTGTLQPRYQASVAFRVAGKISERVVEVGQRVKKGEVLFRLDPEDIVLQLHVAEADQISALSLFKQSTAEQTRLLQLRSTGSVSLSEYELALANRDVAKARVDATDRRLALATNQRTYCDLVADSDGLVTSIQAEAGQVVSAGQVVLQLMRTDELEAIVSLPEYLVADVKKLRATATFWSRPGLKLQAELRELSPMADPISRTYDARFRLIESAPDLTIGMTASVLLRNSAEDGLCIPITSIASRNELPIVWRIESLSGHVEAVAVDIIQYRNETAIVRGPFRSGDRIVSAGVQRVDENSRVRVWESKP